MVVHFKDTKYGKKYQRQKKCCGTELHVVQFPSSLRWGLGEEEGFTEGNTDSSQFLCSSSMTQF